MSDVHLLVDFVSGQKTFCQFLNAGYFLDEILGRRVALSHEKLWAEPVLTGLLVQLNKNGKNGQVGQC